MDEFTSIAIWVMITFMVISAAFGWFEQQTFFVDNGLVIGTSVDERYNQAAIDAEKTHYSTQDCSTTTANPLDYSLCFIGNISGTISSTLSLPGKIIYGLWDLLTNWINLLENVLGGVPGGSLITAILIPFLAIIELTAIFIILLRIAGVIRGGS